MEQRYLPEGVDGGWFQPSDQGYESEVAERLTRWGAEPEDSGADEGESEG